jgi:hypothetical protein
MRECAVCHAQSEDTEATCSQCGANLDVDSATARALRQIKASPRASHVYVVAPTYACPVCRDFQGTFPKNSPLVPDLPHEGCSCPRGCVCRYEPLVIEVGP